MVKIDFKVSLEYDVLDTAGADFVFNIHAACTERQRISAEQFTVNQHLMPELATDPATDSRFVRLHANQGLLVVSYQAIVTVDHLYAEPDTLAEVPVRCLPLDVLPYVYPSRYCQSDRLLKFAWSEFSGLWPGYSRVLAIQHWVQEHLTFSANTSDSTTSAVDTLIERVGVCRDFTHLMIALCRALNIPARIVTGTDFGANPALGPPDFHAYAEVYLGDSWYLFDPSGTGIPMGFIRVGTGRDAADVAFATIFGAVASKAPMVDATVLTGEGLVLPHHCRQALSTTSAATASDSGCIRFDGQKAAGAATPMQSRSLPN
jgi:transglutaminase-like putative cysteine protease